MNIVYISLFGRFQVWCGKQLLDDPCPGKAQELFCYMLLGRNRPHSREALADLLWPDCSTTESRRHLRQALWKLQTSLDFQSKATNDQALLITPTWVQFNPDLNFWLDVAEFEQAFINVCSTPGKKLNRQSYQTLQNAVDLYSGDLLEDCFQDWCLFERERFQNMYLVMLDKLADYCETCRDYETGIVYAERILRQDRAREHAHGRLMRLKYLAGDRTGALRQYQSCVAALGEELGVGPDTQTLILYEQIRTNHLLGPALVPTQGDASPEIETMLLLEVLSHLKHLQALLIGTHNQIEEKIKMVEQVLSNKA